MNFYVMKMPVRAAQNKPKGHKFNTPDLMQSKLGALGSTIIVPLYRPLARLLICKHLRFDFGFVLF